MCGEKGFARREAPVMENIMSFDVLTRPAPKPVLSTVAPAPKAPVQIEWIHPTRLFIDEKVLVNPRMPWDRIPRLQKIADKFDWNKFNPLKVVRRGDKYAILNGGGSWFIVTEIKPELKNFLLPCHVVDERVNTRAKESDIFLAQKDSKRIDARDFFLSDIVHQDAEALDIKRILNGIGMKIPARGWPDGYKSIPVARTLYRAGLLDRVSLICRDVWKDKNPPNAALVAVAIILDAHRVDEKRLRKVLADHDPSDLQVDVKHRAGRLHVYHAATHLAHKYINEYDRDFHGTLLGGTRQGSGTKKRYIPHERARLDAAADRLVNLWRFSNRPAEEADKA
jgi:hypothetical protein